MQVKEPAKLLSPDIWDCMQGTPAVSCVLRK